MLNYAVVFRNAFLKLAMMTAFLLLSVALYSQVPEPKPNSYVSDYANVLTAPQIQQLNEQLRQLEDGTGIQLAVLLINGLPENVTIEDFGRQVGNQWKVGNHFDGLVYVAVLRERKQRLEVARNLEGTIPDITAFQIIEQLKPYLQQSDYFGAVSELIAGVNRAAGGASIAPGINLSDEVVIDSTDLKAASAFEQEKARFDHYGDIAIGVIILALVAFVIWAVRYQKKYVELYTVNGVYTGIGSSYYPSNDADSGGGVSGGGSGFGGFGGGGGGGFSGGGASGSW